MAAYDAFLLLHITAAIIWVGAATTYFMLEIRTDLIGDPAEDARHGDDADWLAPRLFIPASMATLVFGILAAVEGSWDFGQAWIIIGLVGFAMTFAVGMFYFAPEGARLKEAVERLGVDHPEVRGRYSNLKLVGRIEISVLYVVVVAMVLKPTGQDTGVFLGMAAVIVIAAAFAFIWRSRVEQRSTVEVTKAPQAP